MNEQGLRTRTSQAFLLDMTFCSRNFLKKELSSNVSSVCPDCLSLLNSNEVQCEEEEEDKETVFCNFFTHASRFWIQQREQHSDHFIN